MVTQEDTDFYEKNGYAIIKNFLSPEEVQELWDEVNKLIADHINNPDDVIQLSDMGNKKWVTSLERTAIFVEPQSMVDGKLVVPHDKAVHKIAHGLQFDDTAVATKKTMYGDKMKDLVRRMTKQENPKVIQVMYLLKPPRIGEPRAPHQDETYLHTDPHGHVFGVWVALDDVTEQNGCLDFVPGSHKTVPLTRIFKKVHDEEVPFKYTGDADYLHDDEKYEYVRCPVSSGDLVLIHGLVLHKSEANTSSASRWAWAFHAWDEKEGVRWTEDQQFEAKNQPSLYETEP